MKRGYARVSTEDQELSRQLYALESYGCDIVYTEKLSGATTVRPELSRLRADLRAGDVVVVQKLDRLGRSLGDLVILLDEWRAMRVDFVSIGDNFDLSGPIGRLQFHMIASFAEFERALIGERTKDGLSAARKRGQILGRRGLDPEVITRVHELHRIGLSNLKIAQELRISRQSVWRLIKEKK